MLIDQATASSLENLNSHISKFYKEQSDKKISEANLLN